MLTQKDNTQQIQLAHASAAAWPMRCSMLRHTPARRRSPLRTHRKNRAADGRLLPLLRCHVARAAARVLPGSATDAGTAEAHLLGMVGGFYVPRQLAQSSEDV
jgi:hypothetical protein